MIMQRREIKMIYAPLLLFCITLMAQAEESCKVVNGFNLCEDASIIALNTSKEIGLRIKGAEYILTSVRAKGMRVISHYESIYTKTEFNQLMKRRFESSGEGGSIDKLLNKTKKQSTMNLCAVYKKDVFVKDGGSFENHYKYKDGSVFHSVLIEDGRCKEV